MSTRVTEKEKKQKQWELEELLIDDYGLYSFKKFLESDFTVENLLFLEEVEALQELPEKALAYEHLKRIYDNFIDDKGEYCIALSHLIKTQIEKVFQECGNVLIFYIKFYFFIFYLFCSFYVYQLILVVYYFFI